MTPCMKDNSQQYRHVDKSRDTILSCMFQQHMLSVMLRETHFLPCVSSGSSDRRLPADSGSLVTGGEWSAATDPGGQCWRPRSCLLIPVQVSQTVFLTLFCLYCCFFIKALGVSDMAIYIVKQTISFIQRYDCLLYLCVY